MKKFILLPLLLLAMAELKPVESAVKLTECEKWECIENLFPTRSGSLAGGFIGASVALAINALLVTKIAHSAGKKSATNNVSGINLQWGTRGEIFCFMLLLEAPLFGALIPYFIGFVRDIKTFNRIDSMTKEAKLKILPEEIFKIFDTSFAQAQLAVSAIKKEIKKHKKVSKQKTIALIPKK